MSIQESSGGSSGEREAGCLAEELADARLLPQAEVLAILESLTLRFLQAIAKGDDPELHLVRALSCFCQHG